MSTTTAAPFETVIGLEVHVQLAVRSKLFSRAPHDALGEPNSRVDLVDLGLPGVLPVLNAGAVELALRAAVALGGTVRRHTTFDRKNYFYPDLPKGYQISQYFEPYCEGGAVPLGDGRSCRLERIHLEEDAGKSTHTDGGSLIDLNRAGVALIEIVGAPDLRSPQDAHAFLQQLKLILQYAGVSDCDMEKGSLRCDANVSLRAAGGDALGTKVEIKNLNSFKMVERALEYEQRRQAALLSAGHTVAQETRLWNDEKGETAAMRGKESAHDYRYFPDPDLPPLCIDGAWIERVRGTMPELPAARRARYRDELALPAYDVEVLTADWRLGAYFEELAARCPPKTASNWLMTDVARHLNDAHITIDEFPLPPARLAELIAEVDAGTISRQAGKKVLQALVADPTAGVTATIEALGLGQVRDEAALRPLVERVLAAHPQPVADYRAGREKAFHGLFGLCMRESRGKADPQVVQRLLRDLL